MVMPSAPEAVPDTQYMLASSCQMWTQPRVWEVFRGLPLTQYPVPQADLEMYQSTLHTTPDPSHDG